MTLPILIAISLMWVPVALFFMGKGEPKGTGAITGFVGIVVVLGALLQASIFSDPFTAGLLLAHGLLYLAISYGMLSGLQDHRSIGNVSLIVCIISLIYMFLFITGGQTQVVHHSHYMAIACAGYVGLTLMVWLHAYGKFPNNILAMSLFLWSAFGLLLPAFWIMVTGKPPF